MKNIFLFLVICCIIYSCNEPIVKYSKLNKQKTIEQGEWISNLDSLSGISIRENKIAFFKNMEFTSDDIYEYQIIDSIHQSNGRDIKVGEFLMMKDFKDTICYQIINKNDSSLTLKTDKNKSEIFKHKASKK
ncbi:hypothetical protein [Flavobacterium sp. PS2]|uniref:hypothetical protein n=1 Tax=Flavobacterium sp. PS2 TaxID=3384157 RepID=UPI00390C6492